MSTETKCGDTLPLLLLGTVLLALFYLYTAFLKTMVVAWGTDVNYSHGDIIPITSL